MHKDKQISPVHRITVDERLSEDLIRLEICELINKSGEFTDNPEFWKDTAPEGQEILVRPHDTGKKIGKYLYTDVMSIPDSQVKDFPWKDFKEGQVFLSGAFVVEEDKREGKTVKRYFYRSDNKAFEQIDDEVKKNTKSLYYEILAKGDKNGKL